MKIITFKQNDQFILLGFAPLSADYSINWLESAGNYETEFDSCLEFFLTSLDLIC